MVNPNYHVTQSDKIYQEDVVGKGAVMEGKTGEAVTDTAEFYRNEFYQCAIKYNGLIDRILKGNSNG
ncbi:putative o-spanin protein [Hafnia phage vB_HpaM_SarahDanielle]|uniref:O-spanin protein n=1 Tax=Hafnia phage vB_HpaM_SarahDanielle TaxID=2836113 RepID=A0AAE8BDK4_9CAUD|nr:putative o-spanin protein [Hafnia phage vB_HpaM_SarahDanielle]